MDAVFEDTGYFHGPRERLREVGAKNLSNQELLAVLLGTGSAEESVNVLASRMIEECGGIGGLANLGLGQLRQMHGVGLAKGARVVVAVELGRRVLTPLLDARRRLASSRDVFATYGPKLRGLANEHFIAIPLDARGRAIGEVLLAEGEVAACPVAPGEVFRRLLAAGAASAIVIHNHPSGDPRPSSDDVTTTQRLVEAGRLLGIPILDHIIVGCSDYFSFKDAGVMDALLASP